MNRHFPPTPRLLSGVHTLDIFRKPNGHTKSWAWFVSTISFNLQSFRPCGGIFYPSCFKGLNISFRHSLNDKVVSLE